MKQLSLLDKIITHIDRSISKKVTSFPFSNSSQKSIGLMRVNHCGEVCAQALYHGQALVAQNPDLESKLLKAAEEEQQHLDWCQQRIEELGGKTSRLNPLFAIGSFGIGMVAGLCGDAISLGFIAETEHQVSEHLTRHIERLPKDDHKSREILVQMREDETRHAHHAELMGGKELPKFIRTLMKVSAKIMTTTTKLM